ncbi:MAG TPA: prepilin peptidase [Candidatus Saccharimonadales bacterium]|nr:prepilin peptidase [Candidatus Saccharimonadales bacterium]
MIVAILIVLGLAFGSFVNALVWRLHEQEERAKSKEQRRKKGKAKNTAKLSSHTSVLSSKDLSILKGRSMCPSCKHGLAAKDLVPVLSWLTLRGKCRYCHKPISIQYPLVELITATLFVISYLLWPDVAHATLAACFAIGRTPDAQTLTFFGIWLVYMVGFVVLAVYDLKWYLLPNKIVYSLIGVAAIQSFLTVFVFGGGIANAKQIALSFIVGGGLFYLLYQISNGKWIGGGDVKLGMLLGIVLADPQLALFMIFVASLLGSLVTLPLIAVHKLTKTTHIPFGPFLIAGAIVARLFGVAIIAWYRIKLLI